MGTAAKLTLARSMKVWARSALLADGVEIGDLQKSALGKTSHRSKPGWLFYPKDGSGLRVVARKQTRAEVYADVQVQLAKLPPKPLTEDFYITDVATARRAIGHTVYWDDPGTRYVFLRKGSLEDVAGKNLKIDGDWKFRPDLQQLRTMQKGDKYG